MKTVQLTTAIQMHENSDFIIEGIKAAAKTSREEIDPAKVFYFLCGGVVAGWVGLWMQFVEEKPVFICPVVLRDNDMDKRFAEILFVYNLPNAKPHECLEEKIVPWAKLNGAAKITTFNPIVDIKHQAIAHRRLRGYGFGNVRAELFERII